MTHPRFLERIARNMNGWLRDPTQADGDVWERVAALVPDADWQNFLEIRRKVVEELR